jgi:IclR family pca regulon transcriptional regulator
MAGLSDGGESNRYSTSLMLGVLILRCFSGRPLGIADIADLINLSRSTTHRYVSTLAVLGFLEQGPSRKYRLASSAMDFGAAALEITGLRGPALPYLQRLRSQTSYSAGMAVLDGVSIVYVARAPSLTRGQFELCARCGAGSRLPSYCTAAGKVLLAYLPDGEQMSLIESLDIVAHTLYTAHNQRVLLARLDEIHRRLLAVDNQELVEGRVSIAAPVYSPDGRVVAAVDLTVSTSMISRQELVQQMARPLRTTAREISTRLADEAQTSTDTAT